MAQVLDAVVRELNPLYDFSRLTSPPQKSFDSWNDVKESIKFKGRNTAIYILQLPKHIIRGGAVGGTVGGVAGAVTSAVAGDSLLEGLVTGAAMGASAGMFLDLLQYVVRSPYYKIRYNVP